MTARKALRGAARSRIVWINMGLAVLSAVELSSSHLTTLFGAKVTAAILLAGSIVNVVLRFVTTQSLVEKADDA